jgi:hypothetical protein
MIEELVKELQRLSKAEDLLSYVYSYMDSYSGEAKIPDETRRAINDYFDFDDVE